MGRNFYHYNDVTGATDRRLFYRVPFGYRNATASFVTWEKKPSDWFSHPTNTQKITGRTPVWLVREFANGAGECIVGDQTIKVANVHVLIDVLNKARREVSDQGGGFDLSMGGPPFS